MGECEWGVGEREVLISSWLCCVCLVRYRKEDQNLSVDVETRFVFRTGAVTGSD